MQTNTSEIESEVKHHVCGIYLPGDIQPDTIATHSPRVLRRKLVQGRKESGLVLLRYPEPGVLTFVSRLIPDWIGGFRP